MTALQISGNLHAASRVAEVGQGPFDVVSLHVVTTLDTVKDAVGVVGPTVQGFAGADHAAPFGSMRFMTAAAAIAANGWKVIAVLPA